MEKMRCAKCGCELSNFHGILCTSSPKDTLEYYHKYGVMFIDKCITDNCDHELETKSKSALDFYARIK